MTRLLVLAILSSCWHIAVASAPVVLRPPTTGDGGAGDFFGIHLYSDADWLMVGAYGDLVNSEENFAGLKSGSVKVYRKTAKGLVPTQVLSPPAPTQSTLFGDEIQRVGNTLVISAPRFGSGTGGQEGGGVFIFELVAERWNYTRTLVPPSAGAFGRFGESILLRPGELWVGAPQRSGGGQVFRYDLLGGSITPTATLSGSQAGAQLGESMAELDDGQIAIGAPGLATVRLYPLTGPLVPSGSFTGPASFGTTIKAAPGKLVVAARDDGAGKVFRWVRDAKGWQPQPVLTPAAGETGDQFGASLLIVGNQLLIGAPGTNLNGAFDVGAVYQTSMTGAAGLNQRTLPELPAGTLFGSALAADNSDTQIWVGAPLTAVSFQRSGRLFAYATSALGSPQAAPVAQLDRGAGAQLFRFGQAVALDGDAVLAGAFLADTGDGPDAGAAYAFRNSETGWSDDGLLTAADATSDQRLGLALDVSGDQAVVGAYWSVIQDKPEQGAAYFFQRTANGWIQRGKVFAHNGVERDNFGAAVGIDQDLAAVGARGANLAFVDQGAVNVYRRSGQVWSDVAQLVASPPSGGAFFGHAVAVCGNRIVIGAPGVDASTDALDSGLAYVFKIGAGLQPQGITLAPLEPIENLNFGFSVSCHGDIVAIGAPGGGETEPFAGEVHTFVCGDTSCERGAILRIPDANSGDQLGISVAVRGQRILSGISGRDLDGLFDVGAAVLFERTGTVWKQLQKIAAPTAVALGGFGRSVDMDATRMVIASPTSSGDNPAEGSLLILDQPDPPLLRDGFE